MTSTDARTYVYNILLFLPSTSSSVQPSPIYLPRTLLWAPLLPFLFYTPLPAHLLRTCFLLPHLFPSSLSTTRMVQLTSA